MPIDHNHLLGHTCIKDCHYVRYSIGIRSLFLTIAHKLNKLMRANIGTISHRQSQRIPEISTNRIASTYWLVFNGLFFAFLFDS